MADSGGLQALGAIYGRGGPQANYHRRQFPAPPASAMGSFAESASKMVKSWVLAAPSFHLAVIGGKARAVPRRRPRSQPAALKRLGEVESRLEI